MISKRSHPEVDPIKVTNNDIKRVNQGLKKIVGFYL